MQIQCNPVFSCLCLCVACTCRSLLPRDFSHNNNTVRAMQRRLHADKTATCAKLVVITRTQPDVSVLSLARKRLL